jgi:hypothetical protein
MSFLTTWARSLLVAAFVTLVFALADYLLGLTPDWSTTFFAAATAAAIAYGNEAAKSERSA